MAPATNASTPTWLWVIHKLRLVANVLFVLLLSMLDVRDIIYKTAWLGPTDTFSFFAVGHAGIDVTSPLALVAAATLPNATRDSGWGAFLAQCDALYVAPGFFLHALGRNYSVGQESVPQLLFTSSMTVDAVAWASCHLLYIHRRPPVCHSRMVRRFLRRYRMPFPHIDVTKLAQEDSAAEHELLDMLELIGQSTPSYRITCVEGVEYAGPGDYTPTIYGCGSPNVFRSAFVGRHATAIQPLLQPMAWLTVDTLKLFGVDFSVRQNNRGYFSVPATTTDSNGDVLELINVTVNNYSSSGVLFAFMLILDFFLLAVHAGSAIEIMQALLWPLMTTSDRAAVTSYANDHYASIFSRSLYRSSTIIVTTVVSQLLAWQLVLPAAVIWTWTDEAWGRAQAFLTTLRFWVLLLITFNAQWYIIVALHERAAFFVAQYTFITTFQLLATGAVVAFIARQRIFDVGTNKYTAQNQRATDFSTFVDHIAYGNAYNEQPDYDERTPAAILRVLFDPLGFVLGASIIAIYGVLLVKAVYLWWWKRSGSGDNPAAAECSSDRGIPYKRLQVEMLLDTPVRARSLLRSAYSTELVHRNTVYLRAPNYFDFGLITRDGRLRPRRGFFNAVPHTAHVDAIEALNEQGPHGMNATRVVPYTQSHRHSEPSIRVVADTKRTGARLSISARPGAAPRTFQDTQRIHPLHTPLG